MNAHIAIGKGATFNLEYALMVYRPGGNGDERAYVTIHDAELRAEGPPTLGPGRPADATFVRTLAEGLQVAVPPEVLPAHVLCRTPDVIAWWSPAEIRPMHFAEKSGLGELSGRDFPHPALVWKLDGRRLFVRALQESERPGAETVLCHAPYWNTDQAGMVCLGDMRRPSRSALDSLRDWEESFFASQFTGAIGGGGKRTTHKGGEVGLWRALAGKKTMPARLLEPTGQTLLEFIGGGARDNA